MSDAMRDELFQAVFCPKGMECLIEIMFDENNILRTKLNLPPRTKQQLLNAFQDKMESLTDYDWMKKPPGPHP